MQKDDIWNKEGNEQVLWEQMTIGPRAVWLTWMLDGAMHNV